MMRSELPCPTLPLYSQSPFGIPTNTPNLYRINAFHADLHASFIDITPLKLRNLLIFDCVEYYYQDLIILKKSLC